jgi:hypothetical protein
MRYLIVGISLMMACSPSFNPNSGMVETETLDENGETSWEASTGLDSLQNEMDPSYCQSMQPNVAGATSYFYGIYQRTDSGWNGEEQWILHPTDAWTSTDGETCYVTWAINAEEREVAGCPSCDFSLEVNGSLNRQKTDCPEGLWENEEQWSTSYNILVDSGNSIVYFQSDGEIVGSGYSTNTAFNFLSDVSCSWF